ncbi:MAG TPA: hypothetical protein VMU92_03495 [Acidobacteriaceae bacterium]|nr:hypothetical protein [Acidobacteriaceae bacterium]
MNKLIYRLFSLAIAMGMGCAGGVAHAQNPSTVIRVLDASGVEGIAGVVLLVNPGDARKSVAFVTNAQGEAITHDLQCEICTISAFDPRGLFASRTTEFSSSSSSFSLVMQLRPLIDTVGDPKAVSIELVINDSKGEPLAQKNVVIRPTVMTLENNRVSVQKTDSTGHVNVQLRAGDYTVGVLNGGTASEVRFEIAPTKKLCSSGRTTCIVATPQSPHHMKPVSLQLPATNLSSLVHESGHADPSKPQ